MLCTLTSSTTTNWYDVQNHQRPIFVEMTQAATNAGTEGRFTPAHLRERQRFRSKETLHARAIVPASDLLADTMAAR